MPKELSEDTMEALQKQSATLPQGEVETEQNVPDTTDQPTEDTEVQLNVEDVDSQQETTETDDTLDTQAVNTLQEAGYTEEEVLKRIQTDGDITDEFVAELKEKINPEIVDAHVGRIKAEIELARVKKASDYDAHQQKIVEMNEYIHGAVGGKETFTKMSQALVNELKAEDIGRIDAKLQSGNKALVNEGLKEMTAKYNNLRGMGGKIVQGQANTEQVVKSTHITKSEYRRLMASDKYKTDSAYATKVDADRLATRTADSNRYGSGAYYGYHPVKGRYAL